MPDAAPLTAEQFVAKWSAVEQSEAVSREHFVDLCRLLGQPTPTEADPAGTDYAFEKHVVPTAAASKGSKGFGGYVDVWKRGCFIWEYKRKGTKDLTDAYRQAAQYRDALDNPPLTVVCDITRTVIHTHFVGYPRQTTEVRLDELPGRLNVLRRLFTAPDSFRPEDTSAGLTAKLAGKFGDVIRPLVHGAPAGDDLFAGIDSGLGGKLAAAHFLMKVVFCLFAEDIDLLPPGLFTRAVAGAIHDPDAFPEVAGDLFRTMHAGGRYGEHRIAHFNGGLFAGRDDALRLNQPALRALHDVAKKDWHGVDPSIFGTLFERLLDPRKRAQIGAHYTSEADIRLVVDPVVLAPLRREWDAVAAALAADAVQAAAEPSDAKRRGVAGPVVAGVTAFRKRLAAVTVLDPACGSGNFLYVALRGLLDLDNAAVRWAAQHGVALDPTPLVGPRQLRGLELNPYAVELAQVSVWIGHLQWLHDHGIDIAARPVLETLNTIENRDAILTTAGPGGAPTPADWPDADFIVGNPPFLGGSDVGAELGGDYRNALQRAYDLPSTSDLCCYFLEQARRAVVAKPSVRAGLLATQSVRHTASRAVMSRIKETADIPFAWSDRDWVKENPSPNDAAVHVAIVGIASPDETGKILNGEPVKEIFADLTGDIDLTRAEVLTENIGIAFSGTKKGGPFDLPNKEALRMLSDAGNPNGRSNSDVLRPWLNGELISDKRPSGKWIIDFGVDASLEAAADFAAPFAHVEAKVRPERSKNKRPRRRDTWWLHSEVAPGMREALNGLERQLAIKRVSKHQMFGWFPTEYLADDGVYVFARDDDYFLGVLSSSVHELWSRRKGSQRREAESGFRYTASTTFETFPLPWPPGSEDAGHPAYGRVAAAAKSLVAKRDAWLDPPQWVAEVEARVDLRDDFSAVPVDVRPLVRRSAVAAEAGRDSRLRRRTLTALYNERPEWLRLAHLALDRAVLAAYAATDVAGDGAGGSWDESWADAWRDAGAGRPLPIDHPLRARRAEVDAAVLGALLSLNRRRAGGGTSP